MKGRMKINNSREPIQAKDSNFADSGFSNVNLAGALFDNVNLAGATFNDVNLSRVRITAANTTGMTINDVDVSALVHACSHPGRFDEIMPVLRVENMQRAVDWYTQVIGFTLLWRKPADGGGENCMLREGSLTLMLSSGTHLGGKPVFTGTLYFNMKGVAAFFESIKARVDMVWPLEAMDYGTLEFGVRDPDGYTLAFAEHVR
jgi:uncharacterized glyoxalase superfamily protein PhnB